MIYQYWRRPNLVFFLKSFSILNIRGKNGSWFGMNFQNCHWFIIIIIENEMLSRNVISFSMFQKIDGHWQSRMARIVGFNASSGFLVCLAQKKVSLLIQIQFRNSRCSPKREREIRSLLKELCFRKKWREWPSYC